MVLSGGVCVGEEGSIGDVLYTESEHSMHNVFLYVSGREIQTLSGKLSR